MLLHTSLSVRLTPIRYGLVLEIGQCVCPSVLGPNLNWPTITNRSGLGRIYLADLVPPYSAYTGTD